MYKNNHWMVLCKISIFGWIEDLRSILDGCYYRTNLTWDAYGKIVLNYSYLKPLHYFDSKLSWNVLWMVHYQMSIFLYGFEIRKQSASSNKFPTMDPVRKWKKKCCQILESWLYPNSAWVVNRCSLAKLWFLETQVRYTTRI